MNQMLKGTFPPGPISWVIEEMEVPCPSYAPAVVGVVLKVDSGIVIVCHPCVTKGVDAAIRIQPGFVTGYIR